MVVREVYSTQILEVAEIFLDDLHDVLAVELRLDGLVRQLHSAGVQNEETVEKLAALAVQRLRVLH